MSLFLEDFRKQLRNWGDKNPPTFHEIRSLSIRLYTEAYRAEFAQAIAGHKDAAMTTAYRDVRGSEWVQVKVQP